MQVRRDRNAEKGLPSDLLDCDPCMNTTTTYDRRCLGCGFLPPSEHIDGMRPFPEASVCPGYLIRMPEVVEAARALVWAKRGGLAALYGNRALPPVLTEAVDVLDAARSDVERRAFREQREEAERGRA